MAKVLMPLMSAEVRGKVAGLIFNTSRGIKYAKVFTSPAQPRTAAQLKIRSCIQSASRQWAGLTAAQRTGWTNWAAANPYTDWTGASNTWTGHQAYVRLNARKLYFAEAVVATAPVTTTPDAPAGLALTPGSGTCSVAWTALAGTDKQVDIYAWGPHSAGRNGRLERAVWKVSKVGETPPQAVAPLSPGIWTFWIRARSETDGQVSAWVRADATVT